MPNDHAVASSTEPIISKAFTNLKHKVSKLFKPWMIVKLLLGACVCAIALAVGVLLWVVYWPLPTLPHSSSLPHVNNVKGVAGSGTLTLTWDESPGAIGYQVLRSEKPGRNYIVAGSPYGHYPGPLQIPLFWDRLISRILPGHFGRLPHPPFIDTTLQPGHTYYYRVRATDSAGWTTLTAPVGFSIRAPDVTPPTLRLQVDAVHAAGTLQHKWEMAIGSERLSYMLKGDITPNLRDAGISLRKANKMAHDELGMRYIVTHSILNDDVGIYREDESGNPLYNFATIDKLYDAVLSDGMKPYIQLDFMPSQLASDPRSMQGIFTHSTYRANNTPPKDYVKWGAMISALATHLIQRYGREEVESWPFAVWNEPDVCFWFWPACYWKGNAEEYYHLYDYAAVALHSVDPKLRVGGPVTLSTPYVEPFLRHVTSHNYATGGNTVPLDFLDVRIYMQDPTNWTPLLERYGLGKLPVYYSEWGVREIQGDPVNDMPYGAAWIASAICRSLDSVDAISYWTSSDYFDEHGDPTRFFHGGFGLIGMDGIRKPRYWAYYLLHQLGTQRVTLSGEGDGFNTLVNGWATRNDDGSVRILLSNVTNDQTSATGNPALDRRVVLNISGLVSASSYRLQHFRVDNTHTNVFGLWQKMGAGPWPNRAQLLQLHQGDALEMLRPETELKPDGHGNALIEFNLPMPSVSFVVITPEGGSLPGKGTR